MMMIRKILFGMLAFLMMFGTINHVSNSSEEDVILKISKIEEERIVAKLKREEQWMKQISCLARNVYYEARGESYEGQLAVAVVTLNRVENGLFPNDICGVVNERKLARGEMVCQFSWRCEGHTNPKKRVSQKHESYKAAFEAILEYDHLTKTLLTEDTLFFHAKHVKPKWRRFKEKFAMIDNHIFYKNKPGDYGR